MKNIPKNTSHPSPSASAGGVTTPILDWTGSLMPSTPQRRDERDLFDHVLRTLNARERLATDYTEAHNARHLYKTAKLAASYGRSIRDEVSMGSTPYPAGFAALDNVLGLQRSSRTPASVWLARYFPDTGTWHAGNSVVPAPGRPGYRLAGFWSSHGEYKMQLSFERYVDRRYTFLDTHTWPDVREDALVPLLYKIIDQLTNSPEETIK